MAGVGLGLLPLSEATASESPSVKRYVRLGRTGLEISDIGFGGSRLREEKLVHHALDRGINYFDSAESYTGGTSEEVLEIESEVVWLTKRGVPEIELPRGIGVQFTEYPTNAQEKLDSFVVETIARKLSSLW